VGSPNLARTKPPEGRSSAPPPKPSFMRVELSMRSAIIAIVSIGGVWLFLQLWQILLVIVVALMFVGMLNPFVEKLEKRGLSRGYAIAVVFCALFVIVCCFGALTIPKLAAQVKDVVENFPATQEKLAKTLEGSGLTRPFAPSVRTLNPDDLGNKAKEYGISYGPKVAEIVGYGAAAFFLALYIMIDRDRMRGGLFALVPREYHMRLSRVLLNLETIVGGYMRGQAIT
jgi:predicted PurR-regulated permease PerM